MKAGIKNLIKNHPNLLIAVLGGLGFIGFYLSAYYVKGLNSSLLTNLAAGSLIISVTVLVVDSVRNKHERLTLEDAVVQGVSNIQMATFAS